MPLSPSAPFKTASAWAVAVMSLLVVGLGTAPIAAADDVCDNAALRAQNNSTELPECRAYEMVTPPYKQGFAVAPKTFTDDGAVSYVSSGNFAGNPFGQAQNQYLATRTANGWTSMALNPPANKYVSQIAFGAEAQSADLRSSVFLMYPHDDPNPYGLMDIYLRGPDGTFTLVGKEPGTAGALPWVRGTSDDLSHVVFQHGRGGGSAELAALWEFIGTGNQGLPRPVSIDNTGASIPGQGCPNSTSSDGRVIVFTSECAGGAGMFRVWARVGGSATVAVSGSECSRAPTDVGGPCNALKPASYVGAARDGSRVFFTTDQQLVDGDTDQTTDLYACDVPAGSPAPTGPANSCATLTRVSGAASDAQVESVSAVSNDGSRVYFVARGVPAGNLGVNDAAPVAGRDNLYLWIKDAAHPEGEIRFVAELDADDVQRAHLTPDGRYLVFSTASSLVTSGPGADTDGPCPTCHPGARDVYRYDATIHAIVRVSTSVAGDGGNDPSFDASTGRHVERASISADGSLVVFETAEALSARDTDGVSDVYAWRDGHVSLISDGGGDVLWVTPSGRDIFFMTDRSLVSTDGDVTADFYSARVGGGFDLARPVRCAGDGCRGQLSNAPSLAAPRSGLSGDGDPGDDAAATVSLRAVTAAQRRRLAATGKLALTVRANAAGRVSATARATIAGRPVTVGSGRRKMTGPGSVAVGLTLSRKARAQLAARGRLTVKVSVSHSKAAGGRSVTLKLTRARAKKSSAGGRS